MVIGVAHACSLWRGRLFPPSRLLSDFAGGKGSKRGKGQVAERCANSGEQQRKEGDQAPGGEKAWPGELLIAERWYDAWIGKRGEEL